LNLSNARFKRNIPLHMMLIPGIVFTVLFAYVPMAGISLAFQSFIPGRGLFGSEWIGLDNFRYLFHMPDIYQVVYNTVFIAIMKIVAGLVVPIAVALLLNEMRNQFLKRSVQTLIYLPHFLSWVILGGILIDVLSIDGGIVNRILGGLGLDPVFFLGSSKWFPFTLVATDVWKDFGFSTIIYLAAITSIDPSVYEAAHIDGASRWRQTFSITIPGILPTIVLLTVLSLGSILNAGFEQVFILYSPSVYSTGDIIDTMLYRLAFMDAQYSLATAVGLLKSVIGVILISTSYWLAYRVANYRIF